MSFSFCLNKNEMLTLCGLSILYQGLDLKQEGKLMQDGQRLVVVVSDLLEKAEAPGAADFKRLASSMLNLENSKHAAKTNLSVAPKISKSVSPQLSNQQARPQMYRHVSASISESELLDQQEKLRRMTVPNIQMAHRQHDYHTQGRSSLDSNRSESPLSKRGYRASIPQLTSLQPRPHKNDKPPNLDYLSLNNTPSTSQPQSPNQTRSHQPHNTNLHTPIFPTSANTAPKRQVVTTSEWETLLGSLDGGQTNLYDAIYGGPALSIPDTTTSSYGDWSPDSQWDMRNLTVSDFPHTTGPAQSVLSFSDESLSSGEEMSTSDLGLGTRPYDELRNSLLAATAGVNDGYFLDGLDGNFGL